VRRSGGQHLLEGSEMGCEEGSILEPQLNAALQQNLQERGHRARIVCEPALGIGHRPVRAEGQERTQEVPHEAAT